MRIATTVRAILALSVLAGASAAFASDASYDQARLRADPPSEKASTKAPMKDGECHCHGPGSRPTGGEEGSRHDHGNAS